MAVRMRYDVAVDALAIELRPGARVAHTITTAPGVNLDLDGRGHVVTIELLDASAHVPRAELEELPTAADYLTLAEAAAASGLAATTLRGQISKGRLAAVKRGRDWLVDATALLNYLESRDARGRRPRGGHRGEDGEESSRAAVRKRRERAVAT